MPQQQHVAHQHLKSIIQDRNALWREADVPVPTYSAPPPWEPPAAEFTATHLPASKDLCTTQKLRQHALMAMAQVTEPDSAIYFTDGSVDPESGRMIAALVTIGVKRSWRTSDHCSTLQNELVAILQALGGHCHHTH